MQRPSLFDLRRIADEANRSLVTAMRWALEPSAVCGASRRALEKAAAALGLPLPPGSPPTEGRAA